MGRLDNLTERAATTKLRVPWTSVQFAALAGSELPPCGCGERCLATTHFGEWFCPACGAWLQSDCDPASESPMNPPLVACRFWSIFGRAVPAHEVKRVIDAIDAIIEPDGRIVYERRRPGLPRNWWKVFEV